MLITATSTDSEFDIHFEPEIELTHFQRELAFHSLHTYNSIPNVTAANNKLAWETGGKKVVREIPEGLYTFTELARHIEYVSKIKISYDASQKAVVKLPEGTTVDFTADDSIGRLLGFDKRVVKDGLVQGDSLIQISNVNALMVHVDIITGSRNNGKISNVVYSFYPDVAPGAKIVENARHLIYLPFFNKGRQSLDRLRVRITDQHMNPVDFRGEPITITFFLR